MNDLQRPPLYHTWHEIAPVRSEGRPITRYDIVGPVREAGELLAIADTGANGATMASTCNSRPLTAEVLLEEGRYSVIRRRQTFDETIACEQLPMEWHSP